MICAQTGRAASPPSLAKYRRHDWPPTELVSVGEGGEVLGGGSVGACGGSGRLDGVRAGGGVG